jgi:hypothetical protein
MTYPLHVATVGSKQRADDDDELFHFTVERSTRAYSVIVWANPDDENDEPIVHVSGPFRTHRQAEKHWRRLNRLNAHRKVGHLDTVPDALRDRINEYAAYGALRLEPQA